MRSLPPFPSHNGRSLKLIVRITFVHVSKKSLQHLSSLLLHCNFPPIPSVSEGAARYVGFWAGVFFVFHLLLGLASKGFEVLKLICWDREAFKCSKYFEVREEFVLDVTPETTPSGAGGGYSAELGENQLEVPLMVRCHSKRLSPP